MLVAYSLLLTGIFHSLKKRSDVSRFKKLMSISVSYVDRPASCACAKFMAKFIFQGGVTKALSEVWTPIMKLHSYTGVPLLTCTWEDSSNKATPLSTHSITSHEPIKLQKF